MPCTQISKIGCRGSIAFLLQEQFSNLLWIDANETIQAWQITLEDSGSTVALMLTRQSIPVINREKYISPIEFENGAYILSEPATEPAIILIGTGSEVQLLFAAQQKLKEQNIAARVVSMPSWELFEKTG